MKPTRNIPYGLLLVMMMVPIPSQASATLLPSGDATTVYDTANHRRTD